MTPEASQGNLCMTTLNKDAGVTQLMGFLTEAFITFVLVLLVQSVCDARRKDLGNAAPVAVGLAITCCHLGAVSHLSNLPSLK